MKKDRFEELLKEKLDRMEVRPPDDMWARLEQQLPEIRRDLAFGGDTSPDAGNVLSAPKIRRPFRRKMSWAYVAASAGAVMAMVFTMRNLDDGGMMAGGDVAPVVAPVTDPVEAQGESEGTHTVQTVSYPVASANRPGGRIVAARITPPETDPQVGDPVSGPVTGITIDVSETPSENNTRTAATDVSGSASRGPTADSHDNDSDKRTWDGSSMTLEEWQKNRSQKRSRVSTSFFAMNSTGTNNPNGRGKDVADYKGGPKEIDDDLGEEDDNPATRAVKSSTGRSSVKTKHDLPVTFGASVNIGITERLSIETGLTYTFLNTKEEQTGDVNSNALYITKRRMHYMGIPVKVKYDFLQTRFVDVYASAGGALETLVSAKEIERADYGNNNVENNKIEAKINTGSLQASLGANVGAQFNIDKTFGIYLEPGISYYFENGNQPKSYRTENPLNFTVKAGVRIKL